MIENDAQFIERIKHLEVVVHYQPIINNATKQLHKYEALMRLKDGVKILSPLSFLEIAKDNGLYESISIKLYEKVFIKMRKFPSLNVSLNVSMADIHNITFSIKLLQELSMLDNPKRVTLEISELDKINFKESTIFFNKVRKMGANISIDDFGSGYSNLENLLQYDFDYLKLDGIFIKKIQETKYENIVRAIVSYCKEHKIKVIAEYVENKAIFAKVCDLGVDFSQGYYIGKPQLNLLKNFNC